MITLDLLEQTFGPARQQGREWHFPCPQCLYQFTACEKNGQVLVYCHSCASNHHLLSALGSSHTFTRSASFQKTQNSNLETRQWALRIWNETIAIENTLAECYLRRRGINLSFPPVIRFHPGLKHTESGQYFPAVISSITDPTGEFIAIHRIWLSPDGKKAPVKPSKKTLGSFRGGIIQLAEPLDMLALAEGLETALSVQQLSGLPTWASVSSANMKNIRPSASVKTVYIFADHDPAGIKAADQTAAILAREGFHVAMAVSPVPGSDFNDILLKGVVPE